MKTPDILIISKTAVARNKPRNAASAIIDTVTGTEVFRSDTGSGLLGCVS
ncbi:hypothetical protein MA5S0921_2577 [Mycobacteroides abscessus 5S-0921]|nr:hypothetical protein MA5S0304_1845 [Mycobacteroides abscessus 5S-0304]EIU22415.1 hypothetical protein MA5S0708_4865 [Mycobacteroides abscessus 5S-0708]EIU23666.1 hypothetical protein MA5S0817_5186 [Mycobacteroides abscessus 5S-0817]EIU28555.1 hypothetical protein MA5S1212_4573 [Mycobacteroides abscessus 5S-1212]EIU45297.1 hypothetical protein MA5S1215_4892 [Mycobacteroides abscessus 5S-1215]EIU93103.1 hypothetical protein MA5S0921_2577 [Mycobacteroides abscessus 5S-0921]